MHTNGYPNAARTPLSGQRSSQAALWLIAALCAAPVLASYLLYYAFKPAGGSVNYGALIEPQRPIPPALTVRAENGVNLPLRALRGKWIMLAVDASACNRDCVKKLYCMRQVRAALGVERARVVTVWLRTDAAPVPERVQRAYQQEMRFLIAAPAALAGWLTADAGAPMVDHLYLIDPSGNLMMRFPAHPKPDSVKKDLSRLLRWSRIG